MSSLKSPLLFTTTTIIFVITVLFLHLSPVIYSLTHLHPSNSPDQGLLFEDKTRLGSTPPSCHNKCNRCLPCMAVQVPTLPSHDRVQPMQFLDPSSPTANKYTNYKPLGWKCRCGSHFYNP